MGLPLLLRFTSARRHDSLNFLVAFHEFGKHLPGFHVKNMCLDSAMDNYPTYQLLKQNGIRAFIDLNSKSGHPKTLPDTITIDKNGIPICSEGYHMVPNGYDKTRVQLMWRCPVVMVKIHTVNSCVLPHLMGGISKQSPTGIAAFILQPPAVQIHIRGFTVSVLPQNGSITVS